MTGTVCVIARFAGALKDSAQRSQGLAKMLRSSRTIVFIGWLVLGAGAACLAHGAAGQNVAANGSIEIDGLVPGRQDMPEAPDPQAPEPAVVETLPEVSASTPAESPAQIIDHGTLSSIPTVGPFRPEAHNRIATPSRGIAESAASINELKALGKPSAPATAPVGESGETGNDPGLFGRLDPRAGEITRVLGALAAVVGLLLLLKTILRKVGGGLMAAPRPSGVVEVLAKYPMGKGQQLMLLKLARRILLLHQNGASLTTLCEIADGHEVAGILSRLEAGSSQRDAAKFRHALEEFSAEHDQSSIRSAKLRMNLPMGDAEIVDLTRRSNRGLRGLFSLGGL